MVMAPNNPLFNRYNQAVNKFMKRNFGKLVAIVVEDIRNSKTYFLIVRKGISRVRFQKGAARYLIYDHYAGASDKVRLVCLDYFLGKGGDDPLAYSRKDVVLPRFEFWDVSDSEDILEFKSSRGIITFASQRYLKRIYPELVKNLKKKFKEVSGKRKGPTS